MQLDSHLYDNFRVNKIFMVEITLDSTVYQQKSQTMQGTQKLDYSEIFTEGVLFLVHSMLFICKSHLLA